MLLKSQQLQIYKYPLTKLLKLWKMIDEFIYNDWFLIFRTASESFIGQL